MEEGLLRPSCRRGKWLGFLPSKSKQVGSTSGRVGVVRMHERARVAADLVGLAARADERGGDGDTADSRHAPDHEHTPISSCRAS